MPWTKLDDQFDLHRKVRRVWHLGGRALGLHVMAMTYTSRNLFDGFVDLEWIEEQLPNPKERMHAVSVLVAEGLWEVFGDGYQIHDFLDYNPSAAHVEHVREMRRIAGRQGSDKRWQGAKQNGTQTAKQSAKQVGKHNA